MARYFPLSCRIWKTIVVFTVTANLLCAVTLYSLYTESHTAKFSRISINRSAETETVHKLKFDSPCSEFILPPKVPRIKDSWKTIVPGGTYIYSAFYDNRTALVKVIIVGMSNGDTPKKWCQLWYPNQLLVVPAKYDIVPETHERKYAPSIHSCLVALTSPPPYAVSLVENRCDTNSSILRLHVGFTQSSNNETRPNSKERNNHLQTQQNQFRFPNVRTSDNRYANILSPKFKFNYTVCVTPFNFNFNDGPQLIEMIEVNRMFGADHFVFYNYDSGPEVHKILQYYKDKGLVDVLPWKLPVIVDIFPPVSNHEPEIHYFGQLVALNDCIYRSMFNSKYAVLTDLDEIIVPHSDESWDSMLHRVSGEGEGGIAAWMLQNVFFRMDWKDNDQAPKLAMDLNLRTLLKINREDNIYPQYSRSKVIIRPQLVTMTGIHFVYNTLDVTLRTVGVDPNFGLLHHYRQGFGGHDQQVAVEDTIMQKHKDKIMINVKKVHDDLNLL